MDGHRLVAADRLVVRDISPPFSCFCTIEREYGSNPAIHRCFSLARSLDAATLVVERIPPIGLLAEENEDLRNINASFSPGVLHRLSFD